MESRDDFCVTRGIIESAEHVCSSSKSANKAYSQGGNKRDVCVLAASSRPSAGSRHESDVINIRFWTDSSLVFHALAAGTVMPGLAKGLEEDGREWSAKRLTWG